MEDDVPSGSESDSEDDSDSGDGAGGDAGGGASDADLAAVMALESSLESHPYDYELHVQYVTLLRRCRLRGRMRDAREALASRFPLSEQLWREWVEDEIDAAERCERPARAARRNKSRAARRCASACRLRALNPRRAAAIVLRCQRGGRGRRRGAVRARGAGLLVGAAVGVVHRGAAAALG